MQEMKGLKSKQIDRTNDQGARRDGEGDAL